MKVPDQIVELAKHVNLESIRLIKLSGEILAGGNVRFDQFDIDVESGGGVSPDYPKGFACTIGVRIRLHGPDSKEATAGIQGRWLLLYAVADEKVRSGITDHLAAAFAGFNATVNLWPHAREFILNQSWRMGLPPTVLPTFRYEIFPGFVDGALNCLSLHEAAAVRESLSEGPRKR